MAYYFVVASAGFMLPGLNKSRIQLLAGVFNAFLSFYNSFYFFFIIIVLLDDDNDTQNLFFGGVYMQCAYSLHLLLFHNLNGLSTARAGGRQRQRRRLTIFFFGGQHKISWIKEEISCDNMVSDTYAGDFLDDSFLRINALILK